MDLPNGSLAALAEAGIWTTNFGTRNQAEKEGLPAREAARRLDT